MSPKSLSTRSLLELIDLFERSSHAVADGDGQRLHGVPGWDLSRRATLSDRDLAQWTERIGYAGCYPAPRGDESVPVEIEEDDDPGRYRYRCPETFRTKYVSADLVAVHAVTDTKLLNYLADLLGIPQAHRRGITAPAIGGVLWNLGKMRIADAQVDVWLARGLSSSIDLVFDHFRAASQPEQGLIFTTGQALPDIVPPPRSYRIVPIASALVDYAVKPHLDTDLIHRLLVAPAGSKEEKSLPVRFDPYSNTLVIATKADKPWAIKGAKQVAVVKYLVEQFENGRTRVSAGDILVAAHGSREAARGKRVASIFSSNSQWLDYIEHDDAGYGIKLE
ncbi:hypothetical protein [Ralstonia solanacearum]|uniref:hypothetical protein n=1 Tax=Ralstonia solanacearum TaxID=305 RepID=UPI0005AC004A|nr:hypothetical protein [Ralstonia solanacearum]MCL9826650.1 hypothetical protein [Ralstonia solanacearum]MCL9831400.1 hypothetical protein [Ralstonia solanacearum]MCL9836181.1 hypothetical protein [Ralstonia solanacearum]OAI71493.1 hypothetical protein RSP797_12030 [Ralstonia solanacearum]